jgi:hypothetical protein
MQVNKIRLPTDNSDFGFNRFSAVFADMSSHHFVKEGQEPALLIVDALPFSQIGSVLEWVPMVIVMYPALDDVLSWGIKIDRVIAPAEEIDRLKDFLTDQAPVELTAIEPGKDPVAIALSELIESGQTAVNILCNDPWPLFRLEWKSGIQASIITSEIKWSLVTSGSYKKWLSSGTKLSLYLAENQGLRGVDVENDGLITISETGIFWVGESHDQ